MLVSKYTQFSKHDNDTTAIWHSVFGRPMLVPNILAEHLIRCRLKRKDPEIIENFGEEILETLSEAHIVINSVDEENNDIERLHSKHDSLYNKSKIKYLSLIMCEECPFRCKYCIHFANAEHRYNKEKMMSYEVATRSIDEYFKALVDNGETSAYINFGGGEPLLNYSTIEKLLPYIDSYRKILGDSIPIKMGINTNLSLLTREMAETFIKYDVEIAASLDGMKEGNDKVRLNKDLSGTYDRIVRSFDLLEELGRPLDGFAMTVTQDNFSDVDKGIIDWAASRNMTEVRIDIDIVGFVDIPIEDVIERLKMVRSYAKTKGISVIGFWSRAAENLGLIPEEEDIGFCGGERGNSACVAPSGQVFPCGYSNYQIGNYKRISKIYTNDAYRDLLSSRRLTSEPKTCKKCPIFGFCRGGCLITKEANKSSNKKQESMCILYVEMTKAIIHESIDA